MSKLFIKHIEEYAKHDPSYLKGWQEANSQFWLNKDKLYIVYDDDHDDEDDNGNHPFHDVSKYYEWKVE